MTKSVVVARAALLSMSMLAACNAEIVGGARLGDEQTIPETARAAPSRGSTTIGPEGAAGGAAGGGDDGTAGGGDEGTAGGGAAGGSAGGAAGGSAGGAAGGSAGGAQLPLAFTAGPAGCTAMTLDANVDLSGYKSDRYNWSDSSCRPRSAALVRNTMSDPGGGYGGYLRELTYVRNGTTITARGTNTNGYNGWGYVVNHYASSSDSSKRRSGSFRTVFAGAHHAIHEFKVRTNPGGPLDATVHWFFASGRSAPVYFITYDATAAGPNVLAADSRAPYGDMAFEGTAGAIGGIAWGDKFKFTTTSGPVLATTGWDYTQPNIIPYVRMWSQSQDAEMGAVATLAWTTQPAGGDYASGRLGNECWGKTSLTMGLGCGGGGWTMPVNYLWPYQLNQYELPYTNASHRLAWGTTYGAIGKTSYSAFGRTMSGYPTVAYSVLMTIGPKSTSETMAQVTQLEHMIAAQVTGAAYDSSYGVWKGAMTGNRATVTMNPVGGAIEKPIFRLTGFTGTTVSHVTLDGQETTQFFASVDAATQTVWVTLNGTVTGPLTVHVE